MLEMRHNSHFQELSVSQRQHTMSPRVSEGKLSPADRQKPLRKKTVGLVPNLLPQLCLQDGTAQGLGTSLFIPGFKLFKAKSSWPCHIPATSLAAS